MFFSKCINILGKWKKFYGAPSSEKILDKQILILTFDCQPCQLFQETKMWKHDIVFLSLSVPVPVSFYVPVSVSFFLCLYILSVFFSINSVFL